VRDSRRPRGRRMEVGDACATGPAPGSLSGTPTGSGASINAHRAPGVCGPQGVSPHAWLLRRSGRSQCGPGAVGEHAGLRWMRTAIIISVVFTATWGCRPVCWGHQGHCPTSGLASTVLKRLTTLGGTGLLGSVFVIFHRRQHATTHPSSAVCPAGCATRPFQPE